MDPLIPAETMHAAVQVLLGCMAAVVTGFTWLCSLRG